MKGEYDYVSNIRVNPFCTQVKPHPPKNSFSCNYLILMYTSFKRNYMNSHLKLKTKNVEFAHFGSEEIEEIVSNLFSILNTCQLQRFRNISDKSIIIILKGLE